MVLSAIIIIIYYYKLRVFKKRRGEKILERLKRKSTESKKMHSHLLPNANLTSLELLLRPGQKTKNNIAWEYFCGSVVNNSVWVDCEEF